MNRHLRLTQIILWSLISLITLAHAGIHFGLGKAAAKKSAEAINEASIQATTAESSTSSSASGTTSASAVASFTIIGPSYTWTNSGVSTFTVTALESSRSTITATSDIIINLANMTYMSYGQSQSNGIYCQDVNCSYQITQTTIPSGSNSATFYYRYNSTGTAILSATLSSDASTRSTATLHVLHERVRYFHIGHPYYYSSPALASDGTIVIGTSYSLGQNLTYPIQTTSYYLLAFNPQATIKWTAALGTSTFARGAPAIASDGTIYIVSEDKPCATLPAPCSGIDTAHLQAFDSNGNFKWRLAISTHAAEMQIGTLSPSIGADDTIYALGDGIHAITSTGTIKWRLFENGTIFSSPIIDSAGTIYAFGKTSSSSNTKLYALTSTGGVTWSSTDLGEYPIAAPALSGDGYIYALSNAGGPWSKPQLFSISTSSGGLRWSYELNVDGIRSSPAVGSDGTIYFGTKGSTSYLYAITSTGTLKWRYTVSADAPGIGADVYSSPLIGTDGNIYLAAESAMFYAFNSTGTVQWKIGNAVIPPIYGSYNWSSPVINNDGTIYVGTSYGAFVAIKTDSSGISTSSPWPKFHYDNKNTGLKP